MDQHGCNGSWAVSYTHLDVYKRQVHAEAVEQYLNKLPCPKEQKLALLKAGQDDLKNGK